MTTIFADTSYYIALLNRRDLYHSRAVELTSAHNGSIVTTAWVMAELGSYFASGTQRGRFIALFEGLRSNPGVIIVEPDTPQFESGIDLYRRRNDKDWSLVDCISFDVMRERNIADAWTTDHHFQQAGFNALLA